MVSPQSVTLVEFVGGGLTDSLYDDDDHTVYQYHPPTDQWVPLPQYECVWFAMAILTNKLVLVGGYNTSTHQVTNQIAVWDTEGISRGWKHPYPPMTTPRHSPAVATYERQLVVAGGRGDADRLATVPVFTILPAPLGSSVHEQCECAQGKRQSSSNCSWQAGRRGLLCCGRCHGTPKWLLLIHVQRWWQSSSVVVRFWLQDTIPIANQPAKLMQLCCDFVSFQVHCI